MDSCRESLNQLSYAINKTLIDTGRYFRETGSTRSVAALRRTLPESHANFHSALDNISHHILIAKTVLEQDYDAILQRKKQDIAAQQAQRAAEAARAAQEAAQAAAGPSDGVTGRSTKRKASTDLTTAGAAGEDQDHQPAEKKQRTDAGGGDGSGGVDIAPAPGNDVTERSAKRRASADLATAGAAGDGQDHQPSEKKQRTDSGGDDGSGGVDAAAAATTTTQNEPVEENIDWPSLQDMINDSNNDQIDDLFDFTDDNINDENTNIDNTNNNDNDNNNNTTTTNNDASINQSTDTSRNDTNPIPNPNSPNLPLQMDGQSGPEVSDMTAVPASNVPEMNQATTNAGNDNTMFSSLDEIRPPGEETNMTGNPDSVDLDSMQMGAGTSTFDLFFNSFEDMNPAGGTDSDMPGDNNNNSGNNWQ